MNSEEIGAAIRDAAERCTRAVDQVEADEKVKAEDVRAVRLAISKVELSAAVRSWLEWVAFDAKASGY